MTCYDCSKAEGFLRPPYKEPLCGDCRRDRTELGAQTEGLVEALLEQADADAIHKAAMLKGTVYELYKFLTLVSNAAEDCYNAAIDFPEAAAKHPDKVAASEMQSMLRDINGAHHSASDIMNTLEDVRRRMK